MSRPRQFDKGDNMKIEDAKIRPVSSELAPKEHSVRRISLLQEFSKDEIVYVDLEKLIPFKHQSRVDFEESEIASLAKTIKEFGVRQPLTVLARADDNFEIVSGERRYRAAKIAGLLKVPCIVLRDKTQAEAIALIENVQRTDLTPLELGAGLLGLLDRGVFPSQTEMAKQLGITRSTVVECIGFLQLGEEIIQKSKEYRITSREALRKLSSLKSEHERLNYLAHLVNTSDSEDSMNQNLKKGAANRLFSSSIIRISLSDNEFKLQRKRLSNLSLEQRGKLKSILEQLLSDL